MYLANGEVIKPIRKRGVKAWFVRWFCCGVKRENEVMKIYLEINQIEEDKIWGDYI